MSQFSCVGDLSSICSQINFTPTEQNNWRELWRAQSKNDSHKYTTYIFKNLQKSMKIK